MAKKSSSVHISFKPIGGFFKRFHLTFFFVFVISLLAVGVVMINNLLVAPADTTYLSPIAPGTIDQATLDRIQGLHDVSEPQLNVVLPEGRINAFGE